MCNLYAWFPSYHPVPVVFAKAKDVEVWDPEGRKYLDFLSAISAVNQVLFGRLC